MIELKERWAGYNQGETYQLIAAEAYAPIQLGSLTRALRVATNSPNAVHPRDWPHEGLKDIGSVWPNKSEGEGQVVDSLPPSSPGGETGLPSPEE